MPCNDLLPPGSRLPTVDACPSCRYYIKDVGPLYLNSAFVTVYGVACSAVAILFPLPVLTVCNVCLARALRRSRLLQKQYRAMNMRCRSIRSFNGNETLSSRGGVDDRRTGSSRHHAAQATTSSQHRITPTVIGLIIPFMRGMLRLASYPLRSHNFRSTLNSLSLSSPWLLQLKCSSVVSSPKSIWYQLHSYKYIFGTPQDVEQSLAECVIKTLMTSAYLFRVSCPRMLIVLLHEVIIFLHCSRSYKDSYPCQGHNFDTQLDVEKPLKTKSMVT